MQKEIGLYIHIPFCKSKCYYCDFNSYANMENRQDEYFKALNSEIIVFAANNQKQKIKTIFIGGGTPSIVDSAHISNLIDIISRNFSVENNAEISMESNPGTLTQEKLSDYINAGINRLSIGLQAWQNRLLTSIGRIHDRNQFVTNYEQARKAGFKNINADLIFGLPSQTETEWRGTLEAVVELGLEHISAYSLSVEEGTEFHKMLEKGKIQKVSDETDRNMYHESIEILKGNGYKHYEISNFAKPGFECKHNLIYWNAEEYIGFGAGAHSYFNNERFSNINGIDDYINAIKSGLVHKVSGNIINATESMSEFMILGLRLTDGIASESFEARYGVNLFSIYGQQIESLKEKKLIFADEKGIRLTNLGLDLANQVFMEFIP